MQILHNVPFGCYAPRSRRIYLYAWRLYSLNLHRYANNSIKQVELHASSVTYYWFRYDYYPRLSTDEEILVYSHELFMINCKSILICTDELFCSQSNQRYSQFISFIIYSILRKGKSESCLVNKKITKHWPVTKQTRNDDSHMNWHKDD